MYKYSWIALILLGSSWATHAQDSTDVNRFFDDGGNKYSHNALKLGLTPLINGELTAYYERVFTKRISVEIGGGIILPFRLASFWNVAGVPQPLKGNNLQINLKFRPFRRLYTNNLVQNFAVSIGAKQSWFKAMGNDFWVIRDYILGCSSVLPLTDSWSFEFYLGLGASILQPQSSVSNNFFRPNQMISSVLPYHVKICHNF